MNADDFNFCPACRYYEYLSDSHDRCTHPDNINTTVTYLGLTRDYISPPRLLNKDGKCARFKEKAQKRDTDLHFT